ncbi:MAG: preprotein translocase subunit SecG [Candidatus Babeliales bacterium]|jgi:protein translocase SecG subunit
MYAFLMTLFIVLCFFLALFILIQQGKGDLGLGSMGGSQMLFGGSGGQEFFEKATWIMGAVFMFGALGLSILKAKEMRSSVLEGAQAPIQAPLQTPVAPQPPAQAPQLPLPTEAHNVDSAPEAPVQAKDI